jgi:peptidoglycan/LPS O-acetylase OafA/YrhL
MAVAAPRRDDLLTIQALRAIAALMVVVYHALDAWGMHVVGRPADALWGNGSAGVDIFFVISGLVMTISASRVAQRPSPARTFMRQRLTRIVPLYWTVTTAKIALVLTLPALAIHTRLSLSYVAGSYALLPVQDRTGAFKPVLPVGWTLSYEMLFYLLVAIALALDVPIMGIALPAMSLVAAVSFVYPLFANTIGIEFLYGVAIGMAWRSAGVHVRGMNAVATCLLIGGFASILLMPVVSGALRPVTWGLPAACIVGSAVVLESRLRHVLPRWLLAAGDGSYAIYLLHGFVVPAVVLVAFHATLAPGVSLAVIIGASLVISALVGHFAHIWLEQPMLNRFRRRSAVPSTAVAG